VGEFLAFTPANAGITFSLWIPTLAGMSTHPHFVQGFCLTALSVPLTGQSDGSNVLILDLLV